jgi:hypothetical protein
MSRFHSQIRLIFSYSLAAFFVAESFNPGFLRPHIESLAPLVRLSIGLFGVLWLVQAIAIRRKLRQLG